MQFAVCFALLVVISLGLAIQLGPLSLAGIAGILTAMGFIGPTLAYGSSRPGIIAKNPSGDHPGWAQLVHGSYLTLCRASSILARLRGHDPWNLVAPGVLLGARPLAREVSVLLDREGVGAVLDLTCELVDSARLRKRTTYLCLPTLDGTPPSQDHLEAGVAFVEAHRTRHAVYVHCAVGRGRSVTLLAAWMLATGRAESVDEAEVFLVEKRPAVRLHETQKAAVQAWWENRSTKAE